MSNQIDPADVLRQFYDGTSVHNNGSLSASTQGTQLPQLLEQLANAIEDGRRNDATALLKDYITRFQSQEQYENQLLSRVQAVQADSGTSFGAMSSLTRYIQQATTVQFKRSETVIQVATLLESTLSGKTPSEVASTVRRTKQQEKKLEQMRQQVQNLLDSTSIAARVAIVGTQFDTTPLRLGTSTDLQVTVSNVGDDTLTGLQLSTQSPSGVKSGSVQITDGTLPGGGSSEQEISVTGQSVGSYSISVTANTDNAGAATEVTALNVRECVPKQEAGRGTPQQLICSEKSTHRDESRDDGSQSNDENRGGNRQGGGDDGDRSRGRGDQNSSEDQGTNR